MNKSAKGLAQKSAEPQRSANPFFSASGSATSFFQPKLKVGATNDHHEREADQIAERVMSTPSPIPGASSKPFFTPTANQQVQRQDEDESSEVLSEGASIAYEQLKLQPGFEGWKKQQTEALKYKLWDSQPTELKAGVIGFGLSNVGMLGTAFALDPRFRSDTIDFLQDKNLLLPLSLLPYSEYFPVSSFKYKLPTAEYAPYTFKTEFGFDEWFKLAQEKWDLPKVSLGVGIESSHSETSGFKPVTGGSIKLKLGGGIVNLSGFYNQTLPPTPMLISDPGRGEPPMWLMRSLPAQLDANLPKGHGVFLTVDVLRLPELFNPNLRQPESAIQRKENGSGGEDAPYASQAVHEEVNSVRGQPLEANTKQMMESRFGQDFSHVRLHTDNKASESAESINAKAYTSSNHIVFGAGQYQPGTRAGLILLAHELVHVGQQTGTVQRKEAPGPANIVEELREKLNEGGYISAYLKLNDHVDWDDEDKKKWLQNHPEIRFLFLKNLRGDAIADVYSAEQLKLKLPKVSFRIIDCWYQSEREKQALYADFMPLFDYLLGHISPYTGVDIFLTITNLINRIKARKKYQGYGDNPEFHTIHLLAPTVERKIKFYDKYKKTDLFKAAKKKFDPFTGISKETMEILTDTNEVDREKAQEIYRTLKELKPEQLDTFLETAAFAGNLETDKDAQKFYKKKYKKHGS